MTTQEKIEVLKELRWLNFIYNFPIINKFSKGVSYWFAIAGLCHLYSKIMYRKGRFNAEYQLSKDIPELLYYRSYKDWGAHWWNHSSLLKGWFQRHVAINKTIKFLKKLEENEIRDQA